MSITNWLVLKDMGPEIASRFSSCQEVVHMRLQCREWNELFRRAQGICMKCMPGTRVICLGGSFDAHGTITVLSNPPPFYMYQGQKWHHEHDEVTNTMGFFNRMANGEINIIGCARGLLCLIMGFRRDVLCICNIHMGNGVYHLVPEHPQQGYMNCKSLYSLGFNEKKNRQGGYYVLCLMMEEPCIPYHNDSKAHKPPLEVLEYYECEGVWNSLQVTLPTPNDLTSNGLMSLPFSTISGTPYLFLANNIYRYSPETKDFERLPSPEDYDATYTGPQLLKLVEIKNSVSLLCCRPGKGLQIFIFRSSDEKWDRKLFSSFEFERARFCGTEGMKVFFQSGTKTVYSLDIEDGSVEEFLTFESRRIDMFECEPYFWNFREYFTIPNGY